MEFSIFFSFRCTSGTSGSDSGGTSAGILGAAFGSTSLTTKVKPVWATEATPNENSVGKIHTVCPVMEECQSEMIDFRKSATDPFEAAVVEARTLIYLPFHFLPSKSTASFMLSHRFSM